MKKNISDKANIKINAMMKESNLTLLSTAVAIVSFFVLLYSHNSITTDFMKARTIIGVIILVYVAAAVTVAVIAIVKKKYYLFEYTAFCLVMSLGYYLLINGASGLPFINSNPVDGVLTVTPYSRFAAKFLKTTYIIYSLWAVNVLYCVLAIVLHSVKYTKIKKSSVKK